MFYLETEANVFTRKLRLSEMGRAFVVSQTVMIAKVMTLDNDSDVFSYCHKGDLGT